MVMVLFYVVILHRTKAVAATTGERTILKTEVMLKEFRKRLPKRAMSVCPPPGERPNLRGKRSMQETTKPVF